MLSALVQAALRSLILALAVWSGLQIFRIKNIVLQRCAWIVVLMGSLLMPFALSFTAQWRGLPLTTLPSPASLDRLQSAFTPVASKPKSTAASSGNPAIATALPSQ